MTTTAEKAKTYQNYVDGEWVAASGGKTYGVVNPATEEVIGLAPDAARDDMRRAIVAARRAFEEGPWPQMSPLDRARIIRQIADAMEKRKEDIRQILVAEAAAEYATHVINLDAPIQYMYDYAERAIKYDFEEMVPPEVTDMGAGPRLINQMVYHAPVGVCGLIPTWNFPMFVTIQKVGPALATGCTMVIKPSPYAPLINLLLAEIIETTDLPAGVFNVVCGEGVDIGAELVDSPLVDKISFTGSVATGKKIMEAGAKTLKRIHLELGGKSPNIILDDMDVNAVAAGAASPAYFHAGQGCVMNTRVLVPSSQHDNLVQSMVGFVSQYVKIGNPADPQVLLGPLIREERRLKVEEYIASGKEEGAELATGGGRPKDLAKGYFLEPTIFANVKNDMRIAQEEIFGP
ncbi:MAG: aldehyde dehydrogenase family protein, partial [Dehalococcoidia bacterium]